LRQLTHDLGERVKELNCLYGISNLIEKRGISLEEIAQGTADLIPAAWQYPEITSARINLGSQEFKTKNFRETVWKQTSNIIVHVELIGTVEVYYSEEKTVRDEGPFLKEERVLINTIAERLGRITEQRQAEEEIRLLKEKYEDLYNNAPTMYMSIDPKGIVIECNNTILDKLGYTKREFIGKHMTKFVTKESAANFEKDFPKLLKTGKMLGAERQLVSKSREIIDAILGVTVEYDEHGKPIKTRAIFEDITERKQAEEHVRTLTQQLIKVQESERHMISRELHDRVAQDLSTIKISLEILLGNEQEVSPEISQRVSGLSRTLQGVIMAVRDLSYDLRPPGLEDMGLIQTVFQYCQDFSEDNGINVDFHSAGMENLKLDFDTKINLYRLIQEGLNNINKHADASNVLIRLVAASPNIILRIEDDGKGFDVENRLANASNEKRMGIRSMEERVKLLQGEMEIQSRLMHGTEISIKLPYKEKKGGSKKNHIDR